MRLSAIPGDPGYEGYGQDQCAADLEQIRPLSGLHVGQLTLSELEAFSRLCRGWMAERDYSGMNGFMGLPRVRMLYEAVP